MMVDRRRYSFLPRGVNGSGLLTLSGATFRARKTDVTETQSRYADTMTGRKMITVWLDEFRSDDAQHDLGGTPECPCWKKR